MHKIERVASSFIYTSLYRPDLMADFDAKWREIKSDQTTFIFTNNNNV